MESKYNSLKKVNQRLEGDILKLTKQSSSRQRGHARQRSNPDGAQLDDSTSSSGISRSRSNSPQKTFNRSGSTGSQKSRPDPAERRTPLGVEGEATAPQNLRTSPGVQNTTPTSKRALQARQERSKTPSQLAQASAAAVAAKSRSREGSLHGKTNKVQSSALRFSEASPFQRVHSGSSAPSNLASNASKGNLPDDSHIKDGASASNSCHSCPEFDKLSQNSAGSLTGSPLVQPPKGMEEDRESPLSSEDRKAIPERTAIVDDIGCGIGSQGIASHLELDASGEEHGLSHW